MILDDIGFEDNIISFDAKNDNTLCCCQKEVSHDESMKFILMHHPD